MINIYHIDVNLINKYGDNCLLLAYSSNQNLEIIKFLITKQNMNVNFVNKNENNALINACTSNSNLKIIQYLIEELKMNIRK